MKTRKEKINKYGISLIVLVISIIVMLILAGAIIISVNNTGVLSSADKAKLEAEIANEKEILNICIVNAKAFSEDRKLTVDNLENELAQYDAEVFMEIDTIIAKFNKSQRYYIVDNEGKVENVEASGEKTLTIVCMKTDGTELYKKDYQIITDTYSVELPIVEGYEPIDWVATGEITESTTVEIPYYVIFDDDTELVFTGLDSNGKVTTVEENVVSYMIGGETGEAGNGLKDKTEIGILKVPEIYKNKPVVKVQQCSFQFCKIKKIIIGSSIKQLGNKAFSDCGTLKKLVYNNETNAIIGHLFFGSASWTEIEVNSDNNVYKVIDNILYSKDGTKIIRAPQGMKVPDGKLIINDNVTIIENNAFHNCSNIQEVVIGNSVTSVGSDAFNACGIKRITFGNNLKSIGSNAFSRCSVNDLVIPDSVETIGGNAFQGGPIAILTIGKGVKSIGNDAFTGCTSLKKLIYNNESTAILQHAFYNCNKWTEIEVNIDNKVYKVVDNVLYSKDGTKLIRVPQGRSGVFEIPSDVTTISAYAVDNCTKITEVKIGSNVLSIGSHAFNACSSLATIIIDSATVANKVSGTGNNNWGNVINTSYVTTIYINTAIDKESINTFITSNYTYNETSDRPGYYMYTK